ncbi:MAG: acyltransferase [Marinilabiliaceae bacterium]|nr:acyltransferase [Marinilabiliaceae bacterium]
MIVSNIELGKNVSISTTASFNNVRLGDNVKIGNKSTLFGSEDNILEVGNNTEIGAFTILNGYSSKLKIGERCNIGAFCHMITDTGPNGSPKLLKKYPIKTAPIIIGNDSIIGHGTVVIAGAKIGDCAFIMPNSFVNCEVPPSTIYGGSPAKLSRKFDLDEME